MKRALSLFMAIVMVLSLCTVTAFGGPNDKKLVFNANGGTISFAQGITPSGAQNNEYNGDRIKVVIQEQGKKVEVQLDDAANNGSTPLASFSDVLKNVVVFTPPQGKVRSEGSYWYKEAACTNVAEATAQQSTVKPDVFASWTDAPSTPTVIFDPNGGNWADDTDATSSDIGSNKKVALPAAPTREGCEFAGWYKGDGTAFETANKVDSNTEYTASTTVYAAWKVVVTFDGNGGTIGGEKSTKTTLLIGENGKMVTLPQKDTISRVDYKYEEVKQPKGEEVVKVDIGGINWYKDASCTNLFESEKITKNTTLFVKWEEITYEIGFHIKCAADAQSPMSGKTVTWGKVAGNADASIKVKPSDFADYATKYPNGLTFSAAVEKLYGEKGVPQATDGWFFANWLSKDWKDCVTTPSDFVVSSSALMKDVVVKDNKLTVHAYFVQGIPMTETEVSTPTHFLYREYNSKAQELLPAAVEIKYQDDELEQGKTKDYTLRYATASDNAKLDKDGKPVNAGKYDVYAVAVEGSKYVGEVYVGTVTIHERDIDNCVFSYEKVKAQPKNNLQIVQVAKAKTADGKYKVTVKDYFGRWMFPDVLVENVDYTVEEHSNKIVVRGIGNYDGVYTINLKTSTTTSTTTTKTTSAKTFDAGIALYVGMSIAAVTGSAVVMGKKKEF